MSLQVVTDPCWDTVPSRHYLCNLLYRCLDPYPAVLLKCFCPFLPWVQWPYLRRNKFGTQNYPDYSNFSREPLFRSCNHSFIFRLLYSLDLLVAPTTFSGRLKPYTPRIARTGYPIQDVASLLVQFGQLTWLDFHQLDYILVGCSSRTRLTDSLHLKLSQLITTWLFDIFSAGSPELFPYLWSDISVYL